jgi:hypothetical protein
VNAIDEASNATSSLQGRAAPPLPAVVAAETTAPPDPAAPPEPVAPPAPTLALEVELDAPAPVLLEVDDAPLLALVVITMGATCCSGVFELHACIMSAPPRAEIASAREPRSHRAEGARSSRLRAEDREHDGGIAKKALGTADSFSVGRCDRFDCVKAEAIRFVLPKIRPARVIQLAEASHVP